MESAAGTSSDEEYNVESVAALAAKNKLEGRDQSLRGAKAKEIRYKEYSSDGEACNITSSHTNMNKLRFPA